MEIQHPHFSKCHEHPLTNRNVFSVICSGCDQLISGPAYCCTKNDCKYYIHKYCFKLSLELQIKHPFHLQHPLTLQYKHQLDDYNPDDDTIICHACGCDTPDFFFKCSECEFDLDVACASLMPTTTIDNHQHFSKKHLLMLCDMNKDFKFYCNACTLLIEEGSMIYVCLDCHFLLHRSCAELPLTITHPFHPQHPLTLFSKARNPSQQCNACGCREMECYFSCYQCLFQLDIRCALMMLTNIHEGCHEYQIQHFGQTHPLILCNMNKNFKLFCSVCTLPFKDLIYVCLKCKVLLHKSCFELAVEIQHPFHRPTAPSHPLS